jgi:hypothetical protein
MSFPLDVAVGPTGTIYVAEFGANQVRMLLPLSVGGESELPAVPATPSVGWLSSGAVVAAILMTLLAFRARRSG